LNIYGVPAAEATIVSLETVGMKFEGGDSDEGWVFQNVDSSIESNDRILVRGPNGCGKTTLVQLVLGQIDPVEGTVRRSTHNILYFPQTGLSQLL
jgi:ABC transport system ATP-binding/permease protein